MAGGGGAEVSEYGGVAFLSNMADDAPGAHVSYRGASSMLARLARLARARASPPCPWVRGAGWLQPLARPIPISSAALARTQ